METSLLAVLHEIDHEVSSLAAEVRRGSQTHEDAVHELLVVRLRQLLLELDERNGTHLYRDYRICPDPGWAALRRLVWGVERLVRLPRRARGVAYVDFASGRAQRLECAPSPPPSTVRLVCVSDTHLRHRDLQLPPGDVLVHCGDVLLQGGDAHLARSEDRHLADFAAWLEEQPHPAKLLIGGNHDAHLSAAAAAELPCDYLSDRGTAVAGLQFYGSGYSKGHGGANAAFQAQGEEKARMLDFPEGLDVLVTHGPPELTYGSGPFSTTMPADKTFGCADLRQAVERCAPRVHCFGHDHSAHGAYRHGEVLFVCATSVVDGSLTAENPPIVLDVPCRVVPAEENALPQA